MPSSFCVIICSSSNLLKPRLARKKDLTPPPLDDEGDECSLEPPDLLNKPMGLN